MGSMRLRMGAAFGLASVVLCGCTTPPGLDTVGKSVLAVTFPNDQQAFDYFVGKGLEGFQAAGIVGNLDVESGMNPAAVQSGGPGRGIAQWLAGGRWDATSNDNAVAFASGAGMGVKTLALQLDFIWYELETFPAYGLAKLSQTSNVSEATIAFETDFEACGSCNHSQRVSDAENVLASFGSGTVDLGSSTTAAGCTLSTGATGSCIDVAACAAVPDHVATAGLCPGASNIQCCTGPNVTPTPDMQDMATPAAGPVPAQAGGCSVSASSRPTSSLWFAALMMMFVAYRRILRGYLLD